MNAKEFEAWLSRNVGKGGKRPLTDEYNKAKKGSERNPTAEEYASKGVEEYNYYNETRDTRKDDDRENDSSQSSRNQRDKTHGSKIGSTPARLARNLISRVVLVVVGAIIVVSGYRAIKANEAQIVPVVAGAEWKWSDDFGTVTIELLNGNGTIIKEVPATITIAETEATCTTDGIRTYTATFTDDDGNEYSDVKTEIIAAIRHEFVEVEKVVHENGDITIIFECTHCHEQFTITTSIEEE